MKKTVFRPCAAFALAALACAPATLRAADAALVYNKTYQCGKEIIQVSRCRRDSDTPDMPATVDEANFCQVYYLDRPKNGIGGTAFGTELKGDVERRLRACGALAANQQSPQVATAQSAPSSKADALTIISQGKKFFEAKDYARALESFKKAVALDPTFAAYDWLGTTHYALGQYAQALTAFDRCLALQPENAQTLLMVGSSHRQLKQYAEAITALRKAIDLRPVAVTLQSALHEIALAYESSGQTSAAQIAAGRLSNMDEQRGRKLAEEIRKSAARRAANAEIVRGQKLYESREYAQSIAAFQAAIPLAPDATIAALANRWIGSAYRELKNYEKAIAALRESLRLEPNHASTHFGLGWNYHLAKRYPEALASLQESARQHPADPETHYWIGEVHLFGLKQYEKALAAYRESLRLRPNDARTINQMGLAHDALGQADAALADFKEAVRLKPGEPLYYSNLALEYAAMDKFDEADRVSSSLRKINVKKADELDRTLMERQITNAVDGKSKP